MEGQGGRLTCDIVKLPEGSGCRQVFLSSVSGQLGDSGEMRDQGTCCGAVRTSAVGGLRRVEVGVGIRTLNLELKWKHGTPSEHCYMLFLPGS